MCIILIREFKFTLNQSKRINLINWRKKTIPLANRKISISKSELCCIRFNSTKRIEKKHKKLGEREIERKKPVRFESTSVRRGVNFHFFISYFHCSFVWIDWKIRNKREKKTETALYEQKTHIRWGTGATAFHFVFYQFFVASQMYLLKWETLFWGD